MNYEFWEWVFANIENIFSLILAVSFSICILLIIVFLIIFLIKEITL